MIKQLSLAVSLIASLFFTTLPALAQSCGCRQARAQNPIVLNGCCAAMPCCIAQREHQPMPAAVASSAADHSIAALALMTRSAVGELPLREYLIARSRALPVAHSPPRFALFCTFLI